MRKTRFLSVIVAAAFALSTAIMPITAQTDDVLTNSTITDEGIDQQAQIELFGDTEPAITIEDKEGEFNTIQDAVLAAVEGDIIFVPNGVYEECVNLNKAITLRGESKEDTIIMANDLSKPGVTMRGGAVVENFTITRAPETASAWGGDATGVSIIAFSSVSTLKNCIITGNRNGVYINGGNSTAKAVVEGNIITNNRTGINFANSNDGIDIIDNVITDNWTLGLVTYGLSNPTDFDKIILENNVIKGNWYGQILVKDGASLISGTLSIPNTNDFGDSITLSTSADTKYNEPSHADLIPVGFGGTAVKPSAKPSTFRIYNSPNAEYDVSELGAVTYMVDSSEGISYAVWNANNNSTIKVFPGTYNIIYDRTGRKIPVAGSENRTGWYLPVVQDGLKIIGVDQNGMEITDPTNTKAHIYSEDYTPNGSWQTQSLMFVFGDNVSIKGLSFSQKSAANKTMEILGDSFTIANSNFVPLPESTNTIFGLYDYKKYGGGVYINGNVKNAKITNNVFNRGGITFDSTAEAVIEITRNTFNGVREIEKLDEHGNIIETTAYSSIGYTSWANPQVTDISNATIIIKENKFINAGKVNFSTVTKGFADVSRNYWGSESGPAEGQLTGSVSAIPFYTTVGMSGLSGSASVEVDSIEDFNQALFTATEIVLASGEYGALAVSRGNIKVKGQADVTVESIAISGDGTYIENINVTGDVIILPSVGDGDVTLKNLTVGGKLYVQGGGSNSVTVLHSAIPGVVIEKTSGDTVRVVLDEGTTVESVTVTSSGTLLLNGAAVATISVDDTADSIEISGVGQIGSLNVSGGSVSVAQEVSVNAAVISTSHPVSLPANTGSLVIENADAQISVGGNTVTEGFGSAKATFTVASAVQSIGKDKYAVIKVNVSELTHGLAGAVIRLTYDTDYIEYVSVSGATIAPELPSPGIIVLSKALTSNLLTDSTLFTINYKIKDNTPYSDVNILQHIQIAILQASCIGSDGYSRSITELEGVDGHITINTSAVVIGDVDGNSTANLNDVVNILSFVVGRISFHPWQKAAGNVVIENDADALLGQSNPTAIDAAAILKSIQSGSGLSRIDLRL